MCGMVFLSGCVSKEPILEGCYNSSFSSLYLFSFYLGVGLTVMYRFRLTYLFLGVGQSQSGSVISLPLSISTLAPMVWLSFNGIVQGTV